MRQPYTVVYPGTFSPPTYGHLDIVQAAARIYGEIIIVCSENPGKHGNWFPPEESKQLWQAYNLPKGTQVLTLTEFRQQCPSADQIIMVRGLRGDGQQDAQYELDVMLQNHRDFGIPTFTYFFSSKCWQHTSSTSAREFAADCRLPELSQHVAPLVVTRLLEKRLGIRNLFLVAGRPASGKSTFLKMLSEADSRNVVINTDDYNHQLRSVVETAFPGEDLVQVAIDREAELNAVLREPWLQLLGLDLKLSPAGSNVFVESAFGLQQTKRIFRYVGGKVLYVDCGSSAETIARNLGRQTEEYIRFVERIPDLQEAQRIAAQQCLQLTPISTRGDLGQLKEFVRTFNQELWKEDSHGRAIHSDVVGSSRG